ncbi:MAG: hypothetical protein RL091_322 [Verrucomicrobiota bacterium]|jgi:hypothetical protein
MLLGLDYFMGTKLKARIATLTAAAALTCSGLTGRACTIFVLTDADHTLFCNNEDWSNPVTRLWFVPAGLGHLGRASLGFDDGWTQGGVNTAGLAFDWVAGVNEKWEPDPTLIRVRGNPAERMLETCTTVDEAVAFFRTHWEPGFARGRILVADRTGASAVIGVKDGRLHVETSKVSRGFGFGWRVLAERLTSSPVPTAANGFEILQACRQSGETPTRYSNIFDLKRGEIILFPAPDRNERVTLNLEAELAKGGHYYDLPRIGSQLAEPPRALPNNLKRFFLDEFQPLPDQEPAITRRVRRLLDEAARAEMRSDDYAPEFWSQLQPAQKSLAGELRQLGVLSALTLVGRESIPGRRSFLYRCDFRAARVLQRYHFDDRDRVLAIATEGVERLPETPSVEPNPSRPGAAAASVVVPQLDRIADPKVWRLHNRAGAVVAESGRTGVRLDARDGDGIAWLVGSDFAEGTIEIDLRGRNLPGASFVGLAFHGVDDATYDAVYFRAFNFKNPDIPRRARAVQYISHPQFTWDKLRRDFPGQYESAVNPVPDSDGWFHARIVVTGSLISVYVNDATAPSLVVTALHNRSGGRVGLWVGNGSDGAFANLKISRQ